MQEMGASVEMVKVVARFADGKLMKGLTQDFGPNKNCFHLHPAEGCQGKGNEIFIRDLKAVFFVRDFAGNSSYNERKSYLETERPHGRKVEVEFLDGEVMVGSTIGYDSNRQGFFIYPADPNCNNHRIFAVTAAVKSVRFL